ncbi:MAG TPA: Xaa-Pro dipeptidase [Thermoanaerobaculia bacterium]|nr:Xaa-Pro dipeptidase [Thermoanaerobaculia bacterium]
MNNELATLYPAHFQSLCDRHDRALSASGYDSVVIHGGEQHMIFLDDLPYPFKPNPHFKAWVPVLKNPNCSIIYTPGRKPVLLYFQPVDYWHKAAASPSGFWVDYFDVRLIATPEDALKHFKADGDRSAYIGEPSDSFAAWGFAEQNPQNLLDRLHYERTWKTAYEIECMRRANAMAVRGHRAAERTWREGGSEYQIHLDYLRASTQSEAELPYGNIIALNENASILHYQHLERSQPAEDGRFSFLIDAGADFNGYASDITRTYSQRQDEFQQMIVAMDKAQQAICDEVRPGVDYRTLHLLAHQKVAEILSEFRIINVEPESAVELRITSSFLPHGLGHFIGLQVHDVAGFSADSDGSTIPKPDGHPFLRLTRVIEERQVFTIEPGLYFIESLLGELERSDNAKYVDWKRVELFRKFGGIRIEDDLVVTSEGAENLTREAFAGHA